MDWNDDLEKELREMFLDPVHFLERHQDLFGREVHFFTHCHIKAYDKTGEGLQMDRSCMDKYGAPIALENYWMDGYHAMDRMLARQLIRTDNKVIPFPPVAGYVGCAHLYKPGTDHNNEPWNWTGWIPRWNRGVLWDPAAAKSRFINNRFFMGLRASEIQNNAWDYHPVEDVEGPYAGLEAAVIPEFVEGEKRVTRAVDVGAISPGQTDKFRGGFFFEGNSWGRYLHLNLMKTHTKDYDTGDFKRYTWIVHPLAYRATINKLPDNSCVDAIQWCVLNMVKEPHFNNPAAIPQHCNGIELFNDFTYTASYNQELTTVPIEAPDFRIPCFNGERMFPHSDGHEDEEEHCQKYIWWYDTYPLEFAEFLLTTGLARGIWLHPLSANDVGYMDNVAIGEEGSGMTQSGTLANDTKTSRAGKQNPGDVEAVVLAYKAARNYAINADDLDGDGKINRDELLKKYDLDGDGEIKGEELLKTFVKGLPYGEDTAFGYSTIIDPTLKLRDLAEDRNKLMSSSDFGMNKAEECTIDWFIKGQHYAHTGVYNLFSYAHEEPKHETYPIQIEGQGDPSKPCYQMTREMELVFVFHPPNEEKSSSFTHDPSQFIWKYEAQFITDADDQEVTVHGYFCLHDGNKTRLDLSQKYRKEDLKWIRFLSFEPSSPQQRAWFIPIKGMAFGKPRNLLPRVKRTEDNPLGYIDADMPRITNQVAIVEIAEHDEDAKVVTLKEAEDYFKQVYAVESKNLKFFFDHNDSEDGKGQMLCYFFQAYPHRQNLCELSKNLRTPLSQLTSSINDPIGPPRILQNIHGYINLCESDRVHNQTGHEHDEPLPTRLDLCNQWDQRSVQASTVENWFNEDGEENEEAEVGEEAEPVVFFYAIDIKPKELGDPVYGPVPLASKPKPIDCKYNIYTEDSQLWKVEDQKLVNKTGMYETDDIWTMIPEGRMAYIQNQTQNQVLTNDDGKVEMTFDRVSQLWDMGRPDDEGYFTLTWGPTHEILSVNENELTLTNPEIWKNKCPIMEIEDYKHWTGREEVKIVPKEE